MQLRAERVWQMRETISSNNCRDDERNEDPTHFFVVHENVNNCFLNVFILCKIDLLHFLKNPIV